MAGERRKLIIELDIYGVDIDADPLAVAQALGFPLNRPVGFDDLDGYDSDHLMFDATSAVWADQPTPTKQVTENSPGWVPGSGGQV